MTQPGQQPPNPYAPPTQQGWGPLPGWRPQAPPPQTGGAATTALLLAALSWVTCGPLVAIPAMILARRAIRAIERGEANPADLSTAKSAFWIALTSTLLSTVAILGYGLYVFIAVSRATGR